MSFNYQLELTSKFKLSTRTYFEESSSDSFSIPDSYHGKTLKKCTPLVHFAAYFHNQTIFKKSERTFFDQVAIDAKSVLTFENCPLMSELTI